MNLFLLRLFAAILFITVETVFFIALHTYFSRPMDHLRHWFGRHSSRRMVAMLLPLLFIANFAVTSIFTGLASPHEESPAQSMPVTGLTKDDASISDSDLEELGIPKLEDNRWEADARSQTRRKTPIRGVPADDTLR